MKRLFICFSAGALGALANSLAVWMCGRYGITHSAGVAIAPALTLAWLYPRIVWGGLWGLLFMLPISGSTIARGSLISLFPTLAQLFIVFPTQTPHGIAGLGLGYLTPLFVLLFNWIWGIVTALAIKWAR